MKQAIILADGEFPRRPLLLTMLKDAEVVVCCDGAADKLLKFGRESQFLLIEAFAENAAGLILKEFSQVRAVTITVDKPHAIGSAESVAVEICRKNHYHNIP